jgi:DNA-binding FadR family transcriptional regulator
MTNAVLTLTTPKRRQVSDDLEKVRSYITDLQDRGEDRLPPERELAEVIGLTRSRLRGAMKKLVDEQLIWREVGNGTYFGQRPLVSSGSARNTELSELTSPSEVMEARMLLEPEYARLAAFRARGENIAELELCCQKMTESVSLSEFAFWDRRFHRAIARATNSTLCVILLETIQANMDRGAWGELADKVRQNESAEGWMTDHLAILDAIKHRNAPAASDAMRAHLVHVQKIYFGNAWQSLYAMGD